MLRSAVQLLRCQLTQGLSPERASFAVGFGLHIGVFPILGFSTMLCVVTAAVLRLNQPLVLAMNFAMSIPKWLLMIPFLRLGEIIMGADAFPLNLVELTASFTNAPWRTLMEFGGVFFHAFLGWVVVLPLSVFLARAILPVVIRRAASLRAARSSATKGEKG